MKIIVSAGALAFGAALFFGCSSVENAIDCNGICGRYKDCFDSTYDTGACEQRCRDNANSDPNNMQAMDDLRNLLGITYRAEDFDAPLPPEIQKYFE